MHVLYATYYLSWLASWGFLDKGTERPRKEVRFLLGGLEVIVTEDGSPQLECKWMLRLRPGAFGE